MTSEHSSLEHRILEHIARAEYVPVKPRVLAKQLKLDPQRHAELKKTVKRMVRNGQLAYGAEHLVGPPAASETKRTEVIGIFRRAAGGFGFVRPAGTRRAAGKTEDIYIPLKSTGDASSGDTVLVRLRQQRRVGGETRVAGDIVRILERETHQFVGTYSEEAGVCQVMVDGNVFSQPILVGDPGVKSAQPQDKVVLEVIRFPSHFQPGEGVITEVLGARGQPGVDTQLILREFNLPEEYPEEAVEVARQQADRFDESISSTRRDFTGTTIITIDPADARDFDDAISLSRLDNGHWVLGVHIADVSHFVPPRTALDDEAKQRATSVYLPGRVIPMLPEIISNHLASLQPERVRYTKTALIEFTADGARVGTEFFSGAIRSCRRFTYEEVDEFLADRAPWKKKISADVFRLLGDMHELAMILRRRRWEAGAIELVLREVRLDLDADGQVRGARPVENTESHQIIEEFMLSANEAVAEHLADRELPFLRRVHESPDPRKLKDLTEFVRGLGIAAESLESRFEIQRVLEAVAGRPEAYAVNYAVLRSMQKAIYSPADEGHFALASRHYCHFTSPIRRYPDLTVHRLLEALAANQPPLRDVDQLTLLGDHCSRREQRAEAAERELTKIKLLNYLSQRVGEELNAVVTGVHNFGLFAQGIDLPAEGFLHVSGLTDDYYDYDPVAHTLRGRRAGNQFRLGDVLRVAIARVDVDRRVLDFRLTAKVAAARGSASPRKGGSSPHGTAARGPQGKPRPAAETRPTERKKGKASRPGKPAAPGPARPPGASGRKKKKRRL